MKKEIYRSPYNLSNACKGCKVDRADAVVAFLADPCGMVRTFRVLEDLFFSRKKQEGLQQS